MMHVHHAGMGPGWPALLFGGVSWILLLGLIALVAVRLAPASRRPAGQQPRVESALDLLDRRFALGEVDLETYQARRAALEAASTGSRPGHGRRSQDRP